MSSYVLVHGAWHGAWTWAKVVPLLERRGHKAVALDLPAHGDDKTPVQDVTLQSYVDRVCETVVAHDKPVILVGHSMAGVVITQAAEQCPDKVRLLVYLCAFLPADGQSLHDLEQAGTASMVPANVVVDPEAGCLNVRREAIREAFYGECPAEDVEFALAGWSEEPLAPLTTAVRVTEANYGRIPRVYIECLRDRAVAPAVQRRMYEASPCREVISMQTDHSPFFSAPEELVDHLVSL